MIVIVGCKILVYCLIIFIVIDFKKAIDNYDEREQKEVLAALSFPEQELRDLEASHAKIIQFFKLYGLTLESDLDAFYDLFYDEDIRFDYMQAFRQFTRCLNVLYPAKEALPYLADYEVLTAINARAARHFRDGRISMKDVPPKLRAIADVYLQSQGINVKVQPISILNPVQVDTWSYLMRFHKAKTLVWKGFQAFLEN